MKIKLEENISRHLKPVLVRKGHDVLTVGDERLLGKTDVEVGAVAKAEGRMLFTLDLDFADPRKFPSGSHAGIVLFRPMSMGPLAVKRFISGFVRETDLLPLSGCIVVVDPKRVRIRRPPLDTDSPEWEEIPQSWTDCPGAGFS
jgi:predicted nuclease of predicted toxin-antitoxin system